MKAKTTTRNVSHLRLVHPANKRKEEVVEELRVLLAAALNGEIQGIAFAAVLQNGAFIANASGVCHERPTEARGMVAYLADQLAFLVHDRDPAGPR